MTNRILLDVGWEKRILNKLGVDPAYLSEEVINSPDIITVAESNIIKQIPDYATINADSEERIYLEAAVVSECCVLLCPGMTARLPKKETGPHASYELGIDWNKKKTEFVDERNESIFKILEKLFPDTLPSPLSNFNVTFPRRW